MASPLPSRCGSPMVTSFGYLPVAGHLQTPLLITNGDNHDNFDYPSNFGDYDVEVRDSYQYDSSDDSEVETMDSTPDGPTQQDLIALIFSAVLGPRSLLVTEPASALDTRLFPNTCSFLLKHDVNVMDLINRINIKTIRQVAFNEFNPQDLYKLTTGGCLPQLRPHSDCASLQKVYPSITSSSFILSLELYFLILSAYVATEFGFYAAHLVAHSFPKYLKHLRSKEDERNWNFALLYHLEFHRRRLREMKTGDYSEWERVSTDKRAFRRAELRIEDEMDSVSQRSRMPRRHGVQLIEKPPTEEEEIEVMLVPMDMDQGDESESGTEWDSWEVDERDEGELVVAKGREKRRETTRDVMRELERRERRRRPEKDLMEVIPMVSG